MEQPTEPAKKCACSYGKCFGILLLLVFLLGIACWHVHRPPRPFGPKLGTTCTVQFRRDAVGARADSTFSLGSKDNYVSISGELISANHDGFVFRRSPDSISLIWIPRESVLLIEYDEPRLAREP